MSNTILPGIVFQVQTVQCFDQQFSEFSMPHGDQQHLSSSLHKQHAPAQNHKCQCIEPVGARTLDPLVKNAHFGSLRQPIIIDRIVTILFRFSKHANPYEKALIPNDLSNSLYLQYAIIVSTQYTP